MSVTLIPVAIEDCTLTTRRFNIQRTTTKRADLGVQVRRPRRALRARQHLTLAVRLGVKQSPTRALGRLNHA